MPLGQQENQALDMEAQRLHKMSLANPSTPLHFIMAQHDLNLVLQVCLKSGMTGVEVSDIIYKRLKALASTGKGG